VRCQTPAGKAFIKTFKREREANMLWRVRLKEKLSSPSASPAAGKSAAGKFAAGKSAAAAPGEERPQKKRREGPSPPAAAGAPAPAAASGEFVAGDLKRPDAVPGAGRPEQLDASPSSLVRCRT
jgi:hypothetical protein